VNIDHVVLWVESPKNSLDFFVDVVGLRPVRAEEFEEGTAPFPSVRLNDTTVLDLMGRNMLSFVQELTGGGRGSGGRAINHICLSMNAADYSALTDRLLGSRSEPRAWLNAPNTFATQMATSSRSGITTRFASPASTTAPGRPAERTDV